MVTIVYGSSRKGNTETLGRYLLKDVQHESVFLRDLTFEHIEDKRHDKSGFDMSQDDYHLTVERLLASDTIIFATPLYWYGMSDLMKKFISRFSESMRDDDLNFKESMKDKKVYCLVVGGDNARIKALPLIQQFKYICEFLEMTFVDYLIGEANSPDEILQDALALNQADYLNERLR